MLVRADAAQQRLKGKDKRKKMMEGLSKLPDFSLQLQ
jgi:hypothetical protein